ncbi:MAG: response regulator [Nitrospirota bacterium]|nr:response regulator [Nitrospirota bacterium]MDH5586121.1 response regulator [Nitrospirota bacterium]MDH5774796.1 response regulator [Nitrospirota bacterium]
MTTLLVINDDPVQLHLLASVLELSHEQVIRFTCSKAAWQWLQAGHRPDLIVLDLHMPGINGWRFCELLHTEGQPGHSVPPVLIVSATYSGIDAESLLADIGASAFLPMPAEPAQIRAQVARLLEAPSSPKGFHLWIVSAHDQDVARIRSAFAARGWHVQEWQSGTQMLAAGVLPKPDILIIDHPLPDMTTKEVLSWCRRDCPEAMCIELRSQLHGETRRYARDEADYCLPRECDEQELLTHCEKWRWERALTRVEHLLEVRTSDLKESEAQFQELFEILPDILVIYDDQKIIRHINASGANQLGYVPDMLIGRALVEIHPHVKPMEHAKWTDTWLRQKDGTDIPVEQMERVVRFQGRRQTLFVARDMTVRQEMAAENTLLEQQLRQVQKMEAVGRLASGVAHDMNNILTAILAHAGLLKARGKESQSSWKAGDVIEKAVHRGKELTSQLLGFARQGKHHHVPVDLHGVIQEVAGLLSRTVERKISLHTELLAEEPWVVGDPNQLYQVLMNLAVNASDAMSDKGDLVFQTSNETVSAVQAGHIPGLAAGDYVVVRVTDTGDGIPQEVQSHIFEPFFTTKELGQGSGMGLAMVYGIVKNHHGYIGVTSTLGVGTTMRVYLPSILCDAPQTLSDSVATPFEGTGHVLIIDDEDAVAEAAQAILEYVGYTTTICLSGREAVEFFQESAQHVDLVLLDMVMPDMSGPECFAELRRIQPKSKILLCTGYDRNHAVQELLNQGTVGFIQKPYDLDELAHVCADAMQQAASAERCLSGTPS